MKSIIKKCTCRKSKPVFKKYWFANNRIAYKGTCMRCGLSVGWYDGENYKLIVTGNNPKQTGGY